MLIRPETNSILSCDLLIETNVSSFFFAAAAAAAATAIKRESSLERWFFFFFFQHAIIPCCSNLCYYNTNPSVIVIARISNTAAGACAIARPERNTAARAAHEQYNNCNTNEKQFHKAKLHRARAVMMQRSRTDIMHFSYSEFLCAGLSRNCTERSEDFFFEAQKRGEPRDRK